MNKSLVTCQFYGQLGNQLFVIAATLGYAWDYDARAIFPGLHTPRNRTSYNRDKLFFRLDASNPPRNFLNIYRTDLEKEWYSSKKIPFKQDLIIDGYFQSWKHFHHHREKILKTFAPSQATIQYLNGKYGDLLSNPKTVGIHVRTQSKVLHENGHHPFWGMDYYKRAIEQFPSDSLFVVVSDRIGWCKHNFSKLDRKFIFIEGNDAIEDFFLLSKCKHNILCNSTFSWWAAYLNENPDARAIFPEHWKDPTLHINPPAEGFFLPHWTLLECKEREAYPADMWHYDKESQSVDNNN